MKLLKNMINEMRQTLVMMTYDDNNIGKQEDRVIRISDGKIVKKERT